MSASWLARFDAATLDGAALAGFDESTPPVTYRRAESVTFRKTAEQWGGFSNMGPGFPLVVNDIAIRTSEALYQACRFPHRPDVQHEIIAQASPLVAKMKSRKYLRDSRPDFVALRVPIMWWSLHVKLACNSAALVPLLLATSGRVIVEESRRDAFWGAVPDKEYSWEATSLVDCWCCYVRCSSATARAPCTRCFRCRWRTSCCMAIRSRQCAGDH